MLDARSRVCRPAQVAQYGKFSESCCPMRTSAVDGLIATAPTINIREGVSLLTASSCRGSIRDEFRDGLLRAPSDQLVVGDALDPAHHLGPLSSERHYVSGHGLT